MASAPTPALVSSTEPCYNKVETTQQLYTRVRLATPKDVHHIHKLIHKMADYYHSVDTFEATETSLASHLFKHPPFQSFTTFLAEVSTSPFPSNNNTDDDTTFTTGHYFTPVERVVQLKDGHNVVDKEFDAFKSSIVDNNNNDVVVVGFTLIFPNFSTFLGKPGFHLEDLFIREGYRGFGIGEMLLSSVAQHTAKLGYGRVEWTVMDWNVRSHKFYERMGAHVCPEWRICRLSGDNLKAYNTQQPTNYGDLSFNQIG